MVMYVLNTLFLHRYFLLIRGLTLGSRIFLQNQKGEILLVKHTYIPGWHLPGGGVDRGEDVYEAIIREVYEECRIGDLTDLRLLNIMHNTNISIRDHVAIFTARTSEQPKILNKLEIKDAKFFSLEALPADLDDNCLQILNEVNLLSAAFNGDYKNSYYSGDVE